METIDKNSLSELLLNDVSPTLIEPYIYSVLKDSESTNSYDKKFGNIYDWVACNSLYNRLVWGYSVADFASLTHNALTSSKDGWVLDVGCGSLAFAAKTYVKYFKRPVVLLDQSLKLLRIAKSRLEKLNGNVPENMVFLHGDALGLPFKPEKFNTIISLNLLHVLEDVRKALLGLKNVSAENGAMYFTTLVRNNRLADKYLKVWENAGELISRDMDQVHAVFNEVEIPIKYKISGNMAFISAPSN